MGSKSPNIEWREGVAYYRAAAKVDGKTFELRVSLNTRDKHLARERASKMNRWLQQAKKRMAQGSQNGLTAEEKIAIARSEARAMRNRLDILLAEDESIDPDLARDEHRVTLHALDLVAANIATKGLPTNFGSHAYFMDSFVEADPYLESKTLERVLDLLGRRLISAQPQPD